jgi:hypothetical protein
MNSQSIVQLDFQIGVADASEEELDALTRQLLSELRDLDVESAELGQAGAAPEGTKAVDPITIGALAIAVLPNFLPKLIKFFQAWALRGQGRTVKFKGQVAGQAIEFEGSADELHKLIAMLSKPSAA